MRIVGGSLRGRRLAAPAGNATRPTTDRVRESLFNIIESRYRDRLLGGRVGDLFAGTGALGLEALSRGAAHATFVEQSPDACKILQDNITSLGLQAKATLIRGDVHAAHHHALARQHPFDMLFLDPPYGGEALTRALNFITTYKCIDSDGIIVLEFGKSDKIDIPKEFYTDVNRIYGKAQVSLLKWAKTP